MVVGVHSDNPDVVSLVALTTIPAGTTIFVTDNAWTGQEFLTNEGSVSWTAPSSLAAGTVWGYGGSWENQYVWLEPDAGFSLAATGDMLHVYSMNSEDDSSMVHLSSMSFNGDWSPTSSNGAWDDTGTSALPTSAASYSVALSHMDNYVYAGPTSGSRSSLQAALANPQYWQGSNTDTTLSETLPSGFSVSATSAARGYGSYWRVCITIAGWTLLFFQS